MTGAENGEALIYEIEFVDTQSRQHLDDRMKIASGAHIDLVTGGVRQRLAASQTAPEVEVATAVVIKKEKCF
jgi:hypothetical protein